MRCAEITDGTVTNIAIGDLTVATDRGWVIIPDGWAVDIGYAYVDGVFTAPPEPPAPVPQSVTPAQAKAALYDKGLYEAAIAAVAAVGGKAEIYWTSATSFERDNVYVLAIAEALELDSEALDDLFRLAGSQ